jgi:hypothetical protein
MFEGKMYDSVFNKKIIELTTFILQKWQNNQTQNFIKFEKLHRVSSSVDDNFIIAR